MDLKVARDSNLPVPIRDSYWVIPNRLLAGEYPGAERPVEAHAKLRSFLAAGIEVFVDLTEADERLEPYAEDLTALAQAAGQAAVHRRMPIRDTDVPTRAQMAQILDVIDGAVKAGQPVYVHCWGGIGRTGTVVGCYLARHGLVLRDKILPTLQLLRRHVSDATVPSPEYREQRALVRSWVQGD